MQGEGSSAVEDHARPEAQVAAQWPRGSGARSVRSVSLAGLLLLGVLVGLLAFASAPVLAIKTHQFAFSFAGAGTEPGQLTSPREIAVDSVTHDVYVAEESASQVDEYSGSGKFIRAWAANSPHFIAVDNSAGPSAGDVYVGNSAATSIVQKFTAEGALVESWGADGQLDGSSAPAGPFGGDLGLTVDTNGNLLLINGADEVFEFSQDGTFVKNYEAAGSISPMGLGIGVDGEGDLFKFEGSPGVPGAVEELTGSNSDLGQVSAPFTGVDLAIDTATKNLYVATGQEVEDYLFTGKGIVSEQGGATCTVELGVGCPPTDTFGAGMLHGGIGNASIAVDSSNGWVYALESSDRIDVFEPVTLARVRTEPATGLSRTSATLNGAVSPDETTVTGCELEYGVEKGVLSKSAPCAQSLPLTGNSFVPVSAALNGLEEFTTYYYRVTATNSEGASHGLEATFTVPGAPRISNVSAEIAQHTKVGQTTATLNASVDPDGRETSYHFEYGETASYGTSIPVPAATVGSGFEPVPITIDLSGLKVGTVYHYRLIASNEYGAAESRDQQFTTLPAALASSYASNVSATGATLTAQVNPLGIDTPCHFQYVTEAAFAAGGYAGATSAPCPDALGAAEAEVTTSVELESLAPSTVYHYRLVAENSLGAVDGADRTFTTQVAGGAPALPDGRQWELVSPVQKHGAQIVPLRGVVTQAAEDGSAITYPATDPLVSEPAGNTQLSSVLSERGASGWSSQDIAPEHQRAIIPGAYAQSGDEFFSSNLALALVSSQGQLESNLYLRNNSTSERDALLTPANLESSVDLSGKVGVGFVAATPDLSAVILESSEKLTAQGVARPFASYFYEWSEGRLRLIDPSEEPQESSSPVSIAGVTRADGYDSRHVISNDGARIFWTVDRADGNEPLYMQEMASGRVVMVNAAQGVAEPANNIAHFQLASSDGSRVFFTDPRQLTTTAGAGLYVYEVETGKLSLLTTPKNATEAVSVEGLVPGASEDGSYVYLVDSGVLSGNDTNGNGETASAEGHNLYVLHRETQAGELQWRVSFIAALAPNDSPDWGVAKRAEAAEQDLTARVSPDGGRLVFMSDRSLTGYDNVDVRSGQPDEEVYSYDAQTGELVCASCDPTGARPVGHRSEGSEEASLPDLNGAWYHRWLAASLPQWMSFDGTNTLYQPRYLLDSGRLFFNSADALVPWDTNGTEDVYEYEPGGVGDCTSASRTYSQRSGGCVDLISSGGGEEESVFADASASGDDAFFVTADRLAGGDDDNSFDMYDAHACSAAAPCPPLAAAVPPACDTADSCRAAPSPQPAIFGAPSSATFHGVGNLVSAPAGAVKAKAKAKAKRPRCGKSRVRRNGRCLKARRRKRASHRKGGR